MSIINIARNIKQTYPNYIALIKFGKFYHVYGKDAYIISYVFNYQVKKGEMNIYTAGFPENTIDKVTKLLEDKCINYLILDRAVNYDIVDKKCFEDMDSYTDVYNMAHKYISRKNKIDDIYEYLLTNINDDNVRERIQKIEEILYE